MAVTMTPKKPLNPSEKEEGVKKKPLKLNHLRTLITKELEFMRNVFSIVSLPQRNTDEDGDDYIYAGTNGETQNNAGLPKRAQSIVELEERLEKLKSKNNFNLKNKLIKKSLTSKLNKKLKKKERSNKNKVKLTKGESRPPKLPKLEKPSVNIAKPVFNNEGKLVFSKFDFANTGQRDKPNKAEKDPKKILENLQRQEEKLTKIAEEDGGKAQEIREKMSWKNVLQKAEGQKIKDDTTLLKKSIKKMEQKKKHSKKQWDDRIQGVEQKKADRQKKRKENISKKKKEKKSKVVKASAKRGRVVI